MTDDARTSTGPRWGVVALLAAGHGLGDFNAGVLLAALAMQSGADAVLLYLLYNALAFAGQPLAGLLVDRVGRRPEWFSLGGVLSAAALPAAWWRPEVGVTMAGIASAFYHAAGGAEAWEQGGKSARAAGIFAAPGVVGLAVGMWLGARMTDGETLLGGVALLGCAAAVWSMTRAAAPLTPSGAAGVKGLIGVAAGWLVLAAIAARSFAWSAGQEVFFPPEFAVALALAAALGKAGAGFLADRIGRGRVVFGSLVIAAALFAWAGSSPWSWFPAVAALQAGTGPMMAMVMDAWPRRPAFGSGLAQGLAIAAGGVPLIAIGRRGAVPLWLVLGALGLAVALMAVSARSRRKGGGSTSEA